MMGVARAADLLHDVLALTPMEYSRAVDPASWQRPRSGLGEPSRVMSEEADWGRPTVYACWSEAYANGQIAEVVLAIVAVRQLPEAVD